MNGYVNSIQSLGTVDGPGVRFVVFMQGCNLRCGCCHNPETWGEKTGKVYSHTELADMACKYKEYYKGNGGITLSGGEPLLQAKFASELFASCKKLGINTCLDTSGSVFDDDVKKLRGRIKGIPIMGRTADIVEVAKRYNIDEIIICIPSAIVIKIVSCGNNVNLFAIVLKLFEKLYKTKVAFLFSVKA